MTYIFVRLVPCALANFQPAHLIANLYNDARTLMACTFGAEARHLWQGTPIVHHKVDI